MIAINNIMKRKFNCITCNYHTDSKYNFTKHTSTKKHTNNESVNSKHESTNSKHESTNSKYESKSNMCVYCYKSYSRKNNLTRHHKKCVSKLHKIEINNTLNDSLK